MTVDVKPDTWMPLLETPRHKFGNRRLEIHLSNLAMYEMALSCAEIGEVFRMLMAEATMQPVPLASNRRVQKMWDLRDEYRRIGGSLGRAPLPLAVRREVYERDGRACTYCRRPIAWADYQCDHVVAVSRGGSDNITNLVASCAGCNRAKSAKQLEEWLS